MARFDFENAENWDVNLDTLLPVGNHVCTIESASSGLSKAAWRRFRRGSCRWCR